MYDYYTLKLLEELDNKIKKICSRIYYTITYKIPQKVIKNLDYIISIQGDLRLLSRFLKTKAKLYSRFSYPNPVDFEKINMEINYPFDKKFNFKKDTGKIILLGNSGSPTNNHLDLMIKLSQIKKQNFKIICPFSYGDHNYIKKIVIKGKLLFGECFIPLLEFLNPEIFYHILKQIDIAVMNHNWHQGMGTLKVLLFLGKPICMKKTSGYFHIKKIGFNIFSLYDLERLILNELELTGSMSNKNTELAIQYFSKKYAISL